MPGRSLSDTKEFLQILLKEMKEMKIYLLTKSYTMESLEYKEELERYDIHVEPLNANFDTIIAGLHKLPGFDIEHQSLVDEIFYLGTFPLDHKKKREFNSLMDRAGDYLQSYYLSYKLGLQEEGKRETQQEEISSPVPTIPQHQEIAVDYEEEIAEDSKLEGWSSSATLEANAGNEERISKPSSSPDVPSKEAEELDSPSNNTKISITSDGSVSFQDPAVEACLKEEYMEIAVTHELSMTNYTSEPPPTTTKLDLSETSSACPTKMGEGENGPSHCPFPKVVVRSEEVPHLNHNQEKTMNVEHPITVVDPALENYHNINSIGFF